MRRLRREADQARRVGQRHAMGRADPVVGLSLLAVPGPDHAGRRDPDERGRHQTFYDKPEVIEALQYWVDLSRKHKVHPPGIVEWGTTPKDFFETKVAMMWTTTGNLTNVQGQRQVPLRRRDAAGAASGAARPTGGGNFYISKKASRRSRRRRSSSSSGSRRRSAPRSGASTPATSRCARTPTRPTR